MSEITIPLIIEWSAFCIGTIGTIIWAIKWRGGGIESWFWLASSLLWIVFAIQSSHSGLAFRDLIGVGLYTWGIWTHHKKTDT